MKMKVIEWIRCPICKNQLTLSQDATFKKMFNETEDIWDGFLECETKKHRFPIINGVLVLVENFPQYLSNKKNVFENLLKTDISQEMRDFILTKAPSTEQWKTDFWENLASVYIWAHYDDINKEIMLKNTMKHIGLKNLQFLSPQLLYSEIIEMFPQPFNSKTPVLDVGCSVGRMTHALATKSEFALGMDYSFEAIRIAREILNSEGKYEYNITIEGKREEKRTVDVTKIVRENVDFIVSDATNLPFPSNFFGMILSMNMLDVVPFPITYLKEIYRTLIKAGHFLFCDPYSWSRVSSANIKDWIGGKETDPYPGDSSTLLRKILIDKGFEVEVEKDLIPWPLRFDQRYFSIWLVDCLRAKKCKEFKRDSLGDI